MKAWLIITGGVVVAALLMVAYSFLQSERTPKAEAIQTASLATLEARMPGRIIVTEQQLTNGFQFPIGYLQAVPMKPWVVVPTNLPKVEVMEFRTTIHHEDPTVPNQRVDPSRLHLLDSRIQVPIESVGVR